MHMDATSGRQKRGISVAHPQGLVQAQSNSPDIGGPVEVPGPNCLSRMASGLGGHSGRIVTPKHFAGASTPIRIGGSLRRLTRQNPSCGVKGRHH